MPDHPWNTQYQTFPEWMPIWLRSAYILAKIKFTPLKRLLQHKALPNKILAVDAETGITQWSWDDEVWDNIAMAGDEDIQRRLVEAYSKGDPRRETVCLPDNAGIPTINGDGTVFFASGQNGDIHAIKDRDGNGVIDPTEVSTFRTGIGFLNGPAIAPGMLVVSPCWGPSYVFKA